MQQQKLWPDRSRSNTLSLLVTFNKNVLTPRNALCLCSAQAIEAMVIRATSISGRDLSSTHVFVLLLAWVGEIKRFCAESEKPKKNICVTSCLSYWRRQTLVWFFMTLINSLVDRTIRITADCGFALAERNGNFKLLWINNGVTQAHYTIIMEWINKNKSDSWCVTPINLRAERRKLLHLCK